MGHRAVHLGHADGGGHLIPGIAARCAHPLSHERRGGGRRHGRYGCRGVRRRWRGRRSRGVGRRGRGRHRAGVGDVQDPTVCRTGLAPPHDVGAALHGACKLRTGRGGALASDQSPHALQECGCLWLREGLACLSDHPEVRHGSAPGGTVGQDLQAELLRVSDSGICPGGRAAAKQGGCKQEAWAHRRSCMVATGRRMPELRHSRDGVQRYGCTYSSRSRGLCGWTGPEMNYLRNSVPQGPWAKAGHPPGATTVMLTWWG